MKKILGIDVGATGIKGAIVDTVAGELITDRHKLATPQGALPADVASVIKELVDHFEWKGKPVGMGFPSVIQNNKVLTASNIDKSWIGMNLVEYLETETGIKATAVNDADAAGLAEVTHGQGKNIKGIVILLTLGTGIGSAIFKDGKLLQNSELGHLKFKGKIAEKVVANSAREKHDLSWKAYGNILGEFLDHVHRLFYPDLIILGGGISKKFEKYSGQFPDHLKVHPAAHQNNAGIIGAAMSQLV